jgi:hypothetical protein
LAARGASRNAVKARRSGGDLRLGVAGRRARADHPSGTRGLPNTGVGVFLLTGGSALVLVTRGRGTVVHCGAPAVTLRAHTGRATIG